jgi:hypothetical protein
VYEVGIKSWGGLREIHQLSDGEVLPGKCKPVCVVSASGGDGNKDEPDFVQASPVSSRSYPACGLGLWKTDADRQVRALISQQLGVSRGRRFTLIEGFSHFITCMTAPIASGWSTFRRVGFASTGKRRLSRRTLIVVVDNVWKYLCRRCGALTASC